MRGEYSFTDATAAAAVGRFSLMDLVRMLPTQRIVLSEDMAVFFLRPPRRHFLSSTLENGWHFVFLMSRSVLLLLFI